MKIENASQMPKRYFGLHMVEGVAEYREPGSDPYRIFVGENAIKNMDPTFEGKPVYVRHVDEVNLDKLAEQSDGVVVRSFFNKADGKHWVEFMVTSDRGHEALRMGWKLSNAYIPKSTGSGGEWHGVEFAKEVTQGEYEHLAIVPNPRYAESVILTPEAFKKYNNEKELELTKIANSKGETSMLDFFKKAKVENATDLEKTSVVLPKSKVEMTIAQLVTEMDVVKNMAGYAAPEHMVKVGNEEMSVGDLVNKHMGMCQAMEEDKAKKENAEMSDEEKKKKKENEEKDAKEGDKQGGDSEKPQKAGDKEIDMKKNKEDEEKKKDEDKKMNEHFAKLKNAAETSARVQAADISTERVARGKSRYGSN